MKIFFISPVRQVTKEIERSCKRYVKKLEKQGHQVHWPIRDTDQNDVIGINICDTNLRKILESDEIHVWYHKTSTGIHFDLGAVYVLIRILGYKKKVVFMNKEEFKEEFIQESGEFIAKDGKSFLNVLNYLDKTTGITLEKLQEILRKCWSGETSADPDQWTEDNPAWGQCAVTALIVQDFFGGELVRGEAKIGNKPLSHYWNRLPDNSDVDLTKEQFQPGTEISEKLIRERNYVLSYEPARKRYALLKMTVENLIMKRGGNEK